MGIGKTILTYTNPMVIPIGLGLLLSAFLASVFSGTYRNMKKILKEE